MLKKLMENLCVFIVLFIGIGTLFTVFAQSGDDLNVKFLNSKYKNLDDIYKYCFK